METNKVHTLLRQFNETIEKWIAWLDDYTLEMLYQTPQAGSWSLGQVYIHIIDDTRYFAGQMGDSLPGNANGEKEMHEDAKVMFRNNEFPDALLTGPSTNAHIRQPESKHELWQNLVSIKDEVNKLFSGFNAEKAKGKTRHPGLLFFNALEWLQFAEMHMRHHFRQKKRIDEALFA
jgi:hypothetical protein